ncbi:MAG: flagellar hook-basal body complex protein FliE [Gemmatimonadetes bacterium]|nr:flagellar hook-basal body complex protein FliE [Gemmatimonadota bacterium]
MSDPIGGAALRAIQGVGGGQGIGGDRGAITVPVMREGEGSFGDALTRALNDVSAQQDKAADTLGAFLRGEPVELHRVMASAEEAQISLQMLIEVRNKFADAYRTLTTMQG